MGFDNIEIVGLLFSDKIIHTYDKFKNIKGEVVETELAKKCRRQSDEAIAKKG